MIFHQYFLNCRSQMSYLIGDETSGRAVVVDPRRDVSTYLADAAASGLRIERVIETHCHADFLSGHLELAATGAAISYGEGARVDYPVEFLTDRQCLDLGQVHWRFEPLRGTPPSRSASWCTSIATTRRPTVSLPVTPYSSAMSGGRSAHRGGSFECRSGRPTVPLAARQADDAAR